MSGYHAPTFTDACAYMVRRLVRTAYNMAANSVRPAKQAYPVGVSEFATVQIIKGPTGDFGTSAIVWKDDPTAHSTKVIEEIETGYKFTASIQFFRHALPANGADGSSPFGLGAVDKAARLETVLGSTAMMDLMERMGLGLQGSGDPVDVGALVDDAKWEDRGSITLDFVVINREQFILESIASVEFTAELASPGDVNLITETKEVAP